MSTISTFNADCARVISESDPIVYNEIDYIMRVIIKESGDGKYKAEISENTYMTDGSDFTIDYSSETISNSGPSSTISEKYYKVWRDDEEDRKTQIQLNAVVKHFRSLGFNIYIKQNSDTSAIMWEINW